ncbi:YciI family protein [Georgenia alba]|uniref:YciI family protein n=1 Tax=Georgenia alba TaxID=2233858 RepID=A0ABW2QD40_9MICO
MPYLVETFDKPASGALREQLRPEHLNFLDAHRHILLACGAKLSDDGESADGGIYLLDVDTRGEAEEFIAQDPFTRGDLFERVEVRRWRKAYLAGERFI